MWRVACRTAFSFNRSVLVGERPLLVRMALDAGSVSACCQPGLFQLKPAMSVMTIAASHGSFHHFMTERLVELVLRLAVAAHTELRLTRLQHLHIREAWLLTVCR